MLREWGVGAITALKMVGMAYVGIKEEGASENEHLSEEGAKKDEK